MKRKILCFVIMLFTSITVSYSQWTTANLQQGRFRLAAAAYGPFAIFGFGDRAISIPAPFVDIYSAGANMWFPATISQSLGRSFLAGAAANNKIAFAGGETTNILIKRDLVDIYNVSTVSWSSALLSVPRSNLAGAGIGTKILFAGGEEQSGSASNVVDIYETGSNTWTTATLSASRHSMCGTAAGSKIVFAGGILTNGSFSNVVDIYDINTGLWSTATLSQPRGNSAAAASGDKIYIAGGTTTGNTVSKVVDVYDVMTNTWMVDSLSIPRTQLCGAATNGKVFFAGGYNPNGSTYYATVDIFDAVLNTWSIDSLVSPRAFAAATAVQNKFLIGGGTNGGFNPLSTVEIYAVTVGIDEIINNQSAFQLMPNPATLNLQIKINDKFEEGTVTIINAVGEIVYESAFTSSNNNINISTEDLSTGIYIVKVSDGKNVFTQKFIRN